ncbi:ATP-binding protein [Kitasatospora indigofera]|uniref:ATP-binding protein n=1 Tax=Kitasatospora indigofera TaxID=67307 RepID=UPI00365AE679
MFDEASFHNESLTRPEAAGVTDGVVANLHGPEGWCEDVPTSGAVDLPPDPRAIQGLGRSHSLPTALADLVDNSIDAHASRVLIRLVRSSGRLSSLYVVDDGEGMSPEQIDVAMTIGGRRHYQTGDLGRFGIGLQAASLSQAASLTVMSRAEGFAAVGRRWNHRQDDFRCAVVDADFAASEVHRDWGYISADRHGTVIRWDGVNAFPATADADTVNRFVEQIIAEVANHLGLVLHRLLAAKRVEIAIDVHDADRGSTGLPTFVESVNPFGYMRTGATDYPKVIVAKAGASTLELRCHVWPGRSTVPQFKLPGMGGPVQHEGLYFYRNDRLLMSGGAWPGARAVSPDLQLGRVEIDIDDDIAGLFTMNPEKSRVQVGPDFARLISEARADDGTTFDDYLSVAEGRFRESRKRSRGRVSMIPPGKGFDPELRQAIRGEIPLKTGEDPIDIRWERFDSDDDHFFKIDRDRRTIRLNELYRPKGADGRRRSINDHPLVKLLLYLLMEDLFSGEYLGPRDKDNIELWKQLLTTAAKVDRG